MWLDLFSINHHHREQHDADLLSLESCLAQARPTLVCMEHRDLHGDSPKLLTEAAGTSEHRPCLVMYRGREGVRGFHSFDTVHVKYM